MKQANEPTSRQQQAESSRKLLFKVAIDLMEKKGFSGTTIQDICQEAGFSVGTFYHHFKSKDDVFFELYRRADEYFEKTVAKSLEKSGVAADEQVVLFFRHYAQYNKKQGFDNITQLYNTKNTLFTAKGRYMQILLKEVVTAGQAKAEISLESTPDEIVDFFFIMGRGVVYDWCIRGGKYDLVAKMEKCMRKLVRTIRPA